MYSYQFLYCVFRCLCSSCKNLKCIMTKRFRKYPSKSTTATQINLDTFVPCLFDVLNLDGWINTLWIPKGNAKSFCHSVSHLKQKMYKYIVEMAITNYAPSVMKL